NELLQAAEVLLANPVGNLRMLKGSFRRMLDRHELARIAVILHVCESLHDFGLPGDKSHPPADHIKALGHRMDFDADFAGAIHLQEAERRTIECKENMSGILDNDDLVRMGKVDDLAVE